YGTQAAQNTNQQVAMQEEYEVKISIEDNGMCTITGVNGEKVDKCLEHVKAMTAEVELGTTYTGRVTAIKEFGAFVEILPGQEGLVHVSELSNEFIRAVTDVVRTLIGLNNLVCVLLFNVAVFSLLPPSDSHSNALLSSLLLPPAIGAVAGFAMSVWAERLRSTSEEQLLILGGAIGVTALCDLLTVDAMLGTFTCGAVLANASTRDRELLASIRQLDYPLYVLFFALAGANLHIEMLPQIGLVGAAYVLLRTAGKLAGCLLGARWAGFGERHEKWTGPTMLAQAGVAIGLSSTLAEVWPGPGQMLQTVVLGAVVIFELGGPIAVRLGLVHAGEVPVLTLLARRAPAGAFESLHHVVTHFRQSLGVPQGHHLDHAGDILVEHVMRKSVDTIRTDTNFNEVLHLIAHSRYDRFPVVDGEDRFEGVIAYEDIRDMLFDPYTSNLVIAADLVKPLSLIAFPQQTLSE
ncbi:MAG: cation:proton antiporter, partial [Candidatus Latescibacterota bacterium]